MTSKTAKRPAQSFAGPTAAPTLTPKNVFAKELNYQVYRIENVLNVKDPVLVSAFVKKHPEYANRPFLQSFLESYKSQDLNEFIESAKGKTQVEREKLLEGLRRIIYKAKKEKKIAQAEIKKPPLVKEQGDRVTRLEGLLQKKEYTNQDFFQVEKNIASPFDIGKGKLDFNKVRYYYTSILTGQKAFGSRVQNMQKEYTGAITELKGYQKQYTSNSSWKKYAGVVDYSWRKIKGVFSWGKKKLGYKVDTSKKDKVNAAIAKARDFYSSRLEKVKQTKTHIANRTVELKKGLGVFRGDLREKIRDMIVRGEWTEAQKKKSEKAKAALETKRAQLASGLSRAGIQRQNIEKEQKGVGKMQVGLSEKLKKVKLSGPLLDKKVTAVKKRIGQLEKQYGKKDSRVLEMRKVLASLLKGQDRIAQVKEGTAVQLSDAETKFHSLDVLKANIYLSETDIVSQIEKNELALTHTTETINQLTKNRLKLHEILEGMETAYVAVDEFKVNVSKNLDKMTNANTKAVEGIDAQYKYLKQAEATDPGLGTSLYNTVIIGKWGAMGALKVVNHIPSAIAYVFNGRDWEAAKKWSVTGRLGWLQKNFDGWLKKDGFRQYGRENGAWQFIASSFNGVAGVLSTGLSLVNGVGTLVFETDKVIDSLGMMVTDWNMFKEALKGVIHYDDWAEGRSDIAFGKTAGDLIVLFLTAGASSGAQAAAKVGSTAGRLAKMAAFTKGFMKEVARQSWNMPKNLGKFIISLPKRGVLALKTAAGGIHALRTGGMQGLRNFLYDVRLSNATTASLENVQAYVNKLAGKDKLSALNDSTRKLLQNTLKNPNQARVQKLLERLEVEFYSGGWKARQIIGPLRSKLKGYVRLDIKHMKGKEFLRQKYGSLEVAKGISKEATASGNIMTRYQTAKAELAEAQGIQIPKKGKGVNNRMIKNAQNKKTEAIKKAKERLSKEENLLNERYDKMRVKDGALDESISMEEALFRHRKAKAELSKAKEMQVPRKGDIKSARAKRKTAIQEAKKRLVQEKELLNNVKGSTHDLFRDTDSILKALNDTKPEGFFSKIRERGRIKELLKRLRIEKEFGINVGDRIAQLEKSLDAIKIFGRGVKTAESVEKASRFALVERLKSARIVLKSKGLKKASMYLFENVAAWPVWLGSKAWGGAKSIRDAARNLIKKSDPRSFEKVANMNAVGRVSEKINTLLKQGKLKLAVEQYYAARISAHKAGIPFAAMDKSFIGYLHKIMPATAMYLGRVEDLYNPIKIANLPTEMAVDAKKFAEIQKNNLDLMKKYNI